jgi:hypothetical protein
MENDNETPHIVQLICPNKTIKKENILREMKTKYMSWW